MFSISKTYKIAQNNSFILSKGCGTMTPFFSPRDLPRCSQHDLGGKREMLRVETSLLCFGFQSSVTLVSSMEWDFRKQMVNLEKCNALYKFQFLPNLWAGISSKDSTLPRPSSLTLFLPRPQQVHLYHVWETLLVYTPSVLAFLRNF